MARRLRGVLVALVVAAAFAGLLWAATPVPQPERATAAPVSVHLPVPTRRWVPVELPPR